jgi:ATP adenylyltransferase
MAYIDGTERPLDSSAAACPFCLAPARTDDAGLVVARGQTVYAVLNLFPYNPGHLLVCPYRHVADLTELTGQELAELGTMTQDAMRAHRAASGPAGFNLGINQGAVAGAGIAAHLHQHVVPRWPGDANFFPIIAQTRALPELLADTRDRLAEAWAGLGTPPVPGCRRAPGGAAGSGDSATPGGTECWA